METNWILKDHEKVTSLQVMTLFMLFEAAGIDLCVGLMFSKFPCKALAMLPRRGDYVSYYTGSDLDKCVYENAKWISYDRLISMLEEEIKSQIWQKNKIPG